MAEAKAGLFRNRQFHITGLRLPEDITVHSDPELTGEKNEWLCLYPDGTFHIWTHAEFMVEFVPVDQAGKDAVA